MAVEATIVEQLQELRKWQIQQQEELFKKQQEQREFLSYEQDRMFEALSLSVEEMELIDDNSLKKVLNKSNTVLEKKDKDLINFDFSDNECNNTPKKLKVQNNDNSFDYVNNNDYECSYLKMPNVQLALRQKNSEFNNSFNQSLELSIDGVEPLNASHRKSFIIDDLPVPSPKKDFQTLLEERLKECETLASVNDDCKQIIKKPFLKKGQGLLRYMPNTRLDEHKNIKNKTRTKTYSLSGLNSSTKSIKTTPKSQNSNHVKPITPRIKSEPLKKKNSYSFPTTSQKTNLKLNVPLKKSASSKPPIIAKSTPKKCANETSFNNSDIEAKNKEEQDQVQVFEFLEEKAENSSFCSTSSTVIAFLQQSTPLKNKILVHTASKLQAPEKNNLDKLSEKSDQAKANELLAIENNGINKQPDTKLIKTENSKPPYIILPYGTDIDTPDCSKYQNLNQDEPDSSFHVRFSEYNEYKTISLSDSSSLSSDTQTVTTYVNDKGVWSDSVTPDSSDVESIMSAKIKKFADTVDPNDTDDDEISSEKNDDNEKDVTISENILLDDKSKEQAIFKSEILKTQLLKLEEEIETFRKESAALVKQREKIIEEQVKLQEERLTLQRAYKEKEMALEMEKLKTESILQEEKKRLNREKSALEMRMKDAWEKAQKNKNERQEIQLLKEELEDLKEEINQKESKWSAAQARQRSQIRVLQAENSKLKQEIEKINLKKNVKLKKPAATNTKAIHQINKLLDDPKKTSQINKHHESDSDSDNKILNGNVKNFAKASDLAGKKEEKLIKSPESILRKHDLYQALLKDATSDFIETQEEILKSIDLDDKSLQKDENKSESMLSPRESCSFKKYSSNSDENNFCITKNLNTKTHENKQGIREVTHPDGHVEYWYPNGNVKKVFPDKNMTKTIYYNGDVQEVDADGTVRYFYASLRMWNTTTPDGLEILEFPDGQVERRSKDGTLEILFPDGSIRTVLSSGLERWALPDGTMAETSVEGDKIITFPNGQREFHTKEHRRREYPDGTVKLVYPDGIQETRYANGRVRLKDKDGNLIMDSHQQ